MKKIQFRFLDNVTDVLFSPTFSLILTLPLFAVFFSAVHRDLSGEGVQTLPNSKSTTKQTLQKKKKLAIEERNEKEMRELFPLFVFLWVAFRLLPLPPYYSSKGFCVVFFVVVVISSITTISTII